jgi:adenine phosphoribosyltransferase
MKKDEIKKLIRDVADFPAPGIILRDITPLLSDPEAFNCVLDIMTNPYSDKKIDHVAGIDARGFIFGSAIARELHAGFIPLRKKGKLPYKKISHSYELEYGINEIEMHIDALKRGDNVLLIDDLLATGGTIKAACNLIEEIGGNISGISVLIELCELGGREKLAGYDIDAVVSY